MARVTRDQVIQLYRDVLGRDPYSEELAPGGWVERHTRSGMSLDALRRQFEQSDEARRRTGNTTAPTAPAPPDPYQQAVERAQGIFKPVQEAAGRSFGAQRSRIGADFADLETRLREEAGKEQGAFEERQNQLGLLRSGTTGTGVGDIRGRLAKDISRGQIERTIAEADLALKEAGFGADIGTRTLDVAKGIREEKLGGSKLAQELLQSPDVDLIPDDILKQILESYGFTVRD